MEEIDKKVEEYSKFVKDTLRPDLLRAISQEQETATEISDYQELKQRLEEMIESDVSVNRLMSKVDLGHEKVYCRANITDASRVFVHVGIGFHAELLLSEAIAFVDKRITFLESVLRYRSAKSTEIKDHVNASELILDGLINEKKRMS